MSVANKKKKIFDGRYEVLSIVGRGACSVVYHARNVTSPSSEVALKVLINQQGGTSSTDRLRKEALAMVSSRHKYVIRLDDFHSVQDLCYLSMEYAKEGDLRKYSAKLGGKLSIQQAHAFFRQTAEALNFVHRVGITHRDIKPDNILVLNDREIRLTDFGVAVLPGEQASLDDLQQGVGTMSYMAPEVLEGKNCDKVSDIYALGVSFYEIITGKHPFENAPLIKQLEVRGDNNFPHISKLAPGIPKQFADVIMRCMRYQSDKRFLSMNDLLKALNEFPENESSPAPKPPERQTKTPAPQQAQQSQPQSQKKEAPSKKPEGKKPQRIATKVAPKKTKIPLPHKKPDPAPKVEKFVEDDAELDKQLEDEIDDILNELEAAEEEAKTSEAQSLPIEKPKNPTPFTMQETTHPPGDDDTDIDDLIEDIELEEDNGDSSFLADPREKRAQSEKPRYEKPYKHSTENSKPSFLSTLVVAGLLIYVSNYLIYKVTGYRIFGKSDEVQLVLEDDSNSVIPKSSEPIVSFPALPAGMFEGNIYDIIPGQESKLVVISMPEQNSLIFIIGVEGWTPSLSVIPQAKAGSANNSIRVTSNGIVLDVQGDAFEGTVSGVYSNAINGTKGKWQIRPFGN